MRTSQPTHDTPSVGIIGQVCGQRGPTIKRPAKTRQAKPTKLKLAYVTAVCNRWAAHDGPHVMRCERTFAVLAEWNDPKPPVRRL